MCSADPDCRASADGNAAVRDADALFAADMLSSSLCIPGPNPFTESGPGFGFAGFDWAGGKWIVRLSIKDAKTAEEDGSGEKGVGGGSARIRAIYVRSRSTSSLASFSASSIFVNSRGFRVFTGVRG